MQTAKSPALAFKILLLSGAIAACSDGVGKPILRGSASDDIVTSTDSDASSNASNGDAATPSNWGGGLADVPDSEYCAEVRHDRLERWLPEQQLLMNVINLRRTLGSTCAGQANQQPRPPLEMVPELRCSSRKHSFAMATSTPIFTTETNPNDGSTPAQRMELAGYRPRIWAESIALGSLEDAQHTFSSGLDCADILEGPFTVVGVGFYPFSSSGPGEQPIGYWTVDLAAP